MSPLSWTTPSPATPYPRSTCRSFSFHPSRQVASSPARLAKPFRVTVGVRRKLFGKMFGKPILLARRSTILPAVARCLHCQAGQNVLNNLRMILQTRPVAWRRDWIRAVLKKQRFQDEAFYLPQVISWSKERKKFQSIR